MYDIDKLNNIGYANIIIPDNPFIWRFREGFGANIRVPNRLIGHDIDFSIKISDLVNSGEDCNTIELGIRDQNDNLIWSTFNKDNILLTIPKSFVKKDVIKTILLSNDSVRCQYHLLKFSISEH